MSTLDIGSIAFPSQKTLAEKLGLSIKTIIKYNRVLEAKATDRTYALFFLRNF
jgi:hypothetical protein